MSESPNRVLSNRMLITIGVVATFSVAALLMAYAMTKGYPWLPDTFTRRARAEATLDHFVAQTSGDVDKTYDTMTGEFAELIKENAEEFSEGKSKVVVKGRDWDGETLTAKVSATGETHKIELTPEKNGDDVEAVFPDMPEKITVILVWNDGWKVKDYLEGGNSWLEAMKNMPKESDRPENTDAAICVGNQKMVESAFQEWLASQTEEPDLSGYRGGSITDFDSGVAKLTPDYLKLIPHCPTEPADYTYTIALTPKTSVSVSCTNPDHTRPEYLEGNK